MEIYAGTVYFLAKSSFYDHINTTLIGYEQYKTSVF